jgi:hypothetical protein
MTPDDGSSPGESGPLARSPRDLIRRDCKHPGKPHAHGTRVAYVSDRCRCTRCRAANRATDRRRTDAITLGKWEPFIDSRPVRDHLLLMRKEGLGIDRIAQLTAVPRSTIQRILSPDAKRPERIRSGTAKRLMALGSTAEQVSSGHRRWGRDQIERIEHRHDAARAPAGSRRGGSADSLAGVASPR